MRSNLSGQSHADPQAIFVVVLVPRLSWKALSQYAAKTGAPYPARLGRPIVQLPRTGPKEPLNTQSKMVAQRAYESILDENTAVRLLKYHGGASRAVRYPHRRHSTFSMPELPPKANDTSTTRKSWNPKKQRSRPSFFNHSFIILPPPS